MLLVLLGGPVVPFFLFFWGRLTKVEQKETAGYWVKNLHDLNLKPHTLNPSPRGTILVGRWQGRGSPLVFDTRHPAFGCWVLERGVGVTFGAPYRV